MIMTYTESFNYYYILLYYGSQSSQGGFHVDFNIAFDPS